MTRREQLDNEVRGLLFQIGQRHYQRSVMDGEIADLTRKVYQLNVEALQLRQAAEAARAEVEREGTTTLDAQVVPHE